MIMMPVVMRCAVLVTCSMLRREGWRLDWAQGYRDEATEAEGFGRCRPVRPTDTTLAAPTSTTACAPRPVDYMQR